MEKDRFKKLAKSFLATTHTLRREKKIISHTYFSPLTLEPKEQINKLTFFFLIRDPLANVNQIFCGKFEPIKKREIALILNMACLI